MSEQMTREELDDFVRWFKALPSWHDAVGEPRFDKLIAAARQWLELREKAEKAFSNASKHIEKLETEHRQLTTALSAANETLRQRDEEIEGLRTRLRHLLEAINSNLNDGIVLSEIRSSWQVRDATAAMKGESK